MAVSMAAAALQERLQHSRLNLQERRSVAARARPRGRRWWPNSWEAAQLQDDENITIFTADGQVTSIPPVRFTSDLPPPPTQQRLPTAEEQGLCLGSLFAISATNGIDSTRRLSLIGWCQSVEMLSEVVSRTTVRRGGEVFLLERQRRGGLQESLTMALALPLLWGIPPEHERLRSGIESGGGIIDRVVREFFILP